jgi:N-acetylmuramoyl-L-alanine amidase
MFLIQRLSANASSSETRTSYNEKFQQQVADKIVQGIKDFLNSCK